MTKLETEVVDSIDLVNENQWNDVVSRASGGTVFHRAGWLRAIETGLELEPRHVVVRKKGNPVAVFPNFTTAVDLPVSLPFDETRFGFASLSSLDPGFGGPLITSNREAALRKIFAAIDQICDGRYVFHRMRILDPTHVQYAQVFRKRGYRPSLLYCRFLLKLEDYDRIVDEMDAERRKEIRDAKTNDPEITNESINKETIWEFYEEYLKTMDRVDGTPYPFSFFEALSENLGERLEIFTAYVNSNPVGKHLYLRDDDQGSLHYFFAGVDERHFEYSSPALLHDYAFQWGIENGYDVFDFGSTNSHYANGTYRYKKKFGAAVEPVYEWERGHAPIRWRAYRSARRLYRRHGSELGS